MTQIVDAYGLPVGRQEQHDLGHTFLDLNQIAQNLSPEDLLDTLQQEAQDAFERLRSPHTKRTDFIEQFIADHL